MILVLGDTFEDRYHLGRVRGLSAEAPIPILDLESELTLPGGAANVLANAQSLGGKAIYLSSHGNTPIKHRLLTETGQQVARWDERDWCDPYGVEVIFDIMDLCGTEPIDGVVVADYGKGSITPEVIEMILDWDLPTLVDTKSSPQPWLPGGERVTLFPNKKEFLQYRSIYEWFPKVLLKASEEGLGWMEYGRIIISRPALAREVISVNGAGDTVVAACAIALAEGMGLVDMLDFASCAAAISVESPYTTAPSRRDVDQRLYEYSNNPGILPETL
jgi:D-beta-D-heptose 7-phosphate kinase/D-beta-D-heptose 1-phosphate adenosyltransferase